MKRPPHVAVLAVTALFVQGAVAPAQDAPVRTDEPKKDYAQITLEELLNRDISVAATKTRVDVTKAPASVVVLTADDIRRTGARNFGDLLRTIPGIDVVEAYPSYLQASARGSAEVFVNNMLVLIDGRRFESLIAGVPSMEETPLRLEDIKRIEVVKGPAGALYGTNAMVGVISITTYSPSEVLGTTLSTAGGNRNSYAVTLRHAAKIGGSGWAYKVLGGYTYTGTWAALDEGSVLPQSALRKGDFIGVLERKFDDGARLEIEGGYTKGDMASLTIVTSINQEHSFPHFRIGYGKADFHSLLTFNSQTLHLREMIGPVQQLDDKSHSLSFALDRTLRLGDKTNLTVGGNVRHEQSNFTSYRKQSHVVGSVFAQDEQVIVADKLTLFAAGGLSYHPEIPVQFDGNAALVLSPAKDHSLRVSFGRGHRDPSFLENYINFRRRFGPREGYQSPNLDLAPESVTSWEAGYRGRGEVGGSRLNFLLEGFREEVHELISIVTQNITPGTLPQFPTVVVLQQFRNLEDRRGKGFETRVEWERSATRLTAQYAFQDFENSRTGERLTRDIPRHKISGGLRTKLGPFEFDAWVHSVGRTIEQDGYVLVNPRIGLPIDKWDISLQAFNALNDKHVETANERGIRGEVIGRSFFVGITYNVRR